jgi:hypothetical protein
LFPNVPLDGISMLIERFQVTEDPQKPVPPNTECFSVHERSS